MEQISFDKLTVVHPKINSDPTTRMEANWPVSKTINIIAYGSSTFHIAERSGVIVSFPGINNGQRAGVLVQINLHTLGQAVKIDVDSEYNDQSKEAAQIKDRYRMMPGTMRRGSCYEYFVSEAEIRNNGGVVYVGNLDVVISLLDPREMVVYHPYSQTGFTKTIVSDVARDTDCSTIRLMLVENSGKGCRRWAMFGNKPYAVEPIKAQNLRDGLYITSNANTGTDRGKGLTREVFIPLEEVNSDKSELVLYRSYEEAIHYGDESRAHDLNLLRCKRELEEAKLDNERLKQDFETNKRTMENDRLIREEEIRKHLRELEILDTELRLIREQNMARIKEESELRSIERKETSEKIKTSSGVVTGILGLFKQFIELLTVVAKQG